MSPADMLKAQSDDPDISAVVSILRDYPHGKPSRQALSSYSSVVKSILTKWGALTIHHGILYRKPKDAVSFAPLHFVVPASLQRLFFKELHGSPISGHQGVQRTLLLLQARFYWPHMLEHIRLWCQECHTCMRNKRLPINRLSALQQHISGAPFERVAVDLMGPFTRTSNGSLYIIVFQDYFTKWLQAVPLPDKTTLSVADAFYTQWVVYYGCPYELHSDQGGEFTSDLLAHMCARLRIHKTFTSAYRPQSDSMVERSNRTLQDLLRTVVSSARDDWDDHLPSVVCAYRTTPHDSTGFSPFRMVFGHEITLPIDLQYDAGLRHKTPECPAEYVIWLEHSMALAHQVARVNLAKSARRQKKNYCDRSRDTQFYPGDWVWKLDPVLRPGKLHLKNDGPFLVLAVRGPVSYEIQRSAESRIQVVHVDKLYRYIPDPDEVLTPWRDFSAQGISVASQTAPLDAPTTVTDVAPDLDHHTPIVDTQHHAAVPCSGPCSPCDINTAPALPPRDVEPVDIFPPITDEPALAPLSQTLTPTAVLATASSDSTETATCARPSPARPCPPIPAPRRSTRSRRAPDHFTPVKSLQMSPADSSASPAVMEALASLLHALA